MHQSPENWRVMDGMLPALKVCLLSKNVFFSKNISRVSDEKIVEYLSSLPLPNIIQKDAERNIAYEH